MVLWLTTKQTFELIGLVDVNIHELENKKVLLDSENETLRHYKEIRRKLNAIISYTAYR